MISIIIIITILSLLVIAGAIVIGVMASNSNENSIISVTTAIPADIDRLIVLYDGNNNTMGTVPIDSTRYEALEIVSILEPGNLYRTGFQFLSWNTNENGTGTTFLPGVTFELGTSSVTLYAQWVEGFKLIYDGSANLVGTAPIDPNVYDISQTATILAGGDLGVTGKYFTGWKTFNANGYFLSPDDLFAMNQKAQILCFASTSLPIDPSFDFSSNNVTFDIGYKTDGGFINTALITIDTIAVGSQLELVSNIQLAVDAAVGVGEITVSLSLKGFLLFTAETYLSFTIAELKEGAGGGLPELGFGNGVLIPFLFVKFSGLRPGGNVILYAQYDDFDFS